MGVARVGMLLLEAASQVTLSEWALLFLGLLSFFFYRALELHLLQDVFTAFRGHPVQLLFNASSSLASHVLPNCRILHGRYWPTPWLCSPHLQTAFLHFFGRPPQVEYHRQLCRTPDGGTIALDWLSPNDLESLNHGSSDGTRIVVVIPGLTSDSSDAYIKHIASTLAASGWRVVVTNHRGLGGVSITSKQFYNGGWTEDLRRIINHLHQLYPRAPLVAVGTSIGANVLVKYLGEEGENTPLGGAAAISCPWDLLICERFIRRRWVQRLYDKILASGLVNYAALHRMALSQIADCDLISKARSMREFDHHFTRFVGQYETVDTYYRKNSSSFYLHSVSIPLLCVNAFDDPVCTKEAIPWDECRVSSNVVLCITKHGGHLAFFEGLAARSIWWVGATTEFLENLCASSLLHVKKQEPIPSSGMSRFLENVTDSSPYLNLLQDGVIATEVLPKDADEGFVQVLSEDEQQVDTKGSMKAHGDLATSPTPPESFYFPNLEGANTEKPLPLMSTNASETESLASISSTCLENNRELYQPTLQLSLQDHSQMLLLESTLSQLLHQVQTYKQVEQKPKESAFSFQTHREVPNASNEEGTSGETLVTTDRKGTLSPRKKTLASLHRSGSKPGDSDVVSCKGLGVVARQNRQTLWLLAYVAIATTWPLVGSALFLHGKFRLKNLFRKFMSGQ